MSEPDRVREIPEDILLRRLEAFEHDRAFYLQMWIQNPALAERAGARVQALLRPLDSSLDMFSSRSPRP